MILKAKARFDFSQSGEDMQFTDRPMKRFMGVLAATISIGSAVQLSGMTPAYAAQDTQPVQSAAYDQWFHPADDDWS
ncbi:hypothetical protein [Streptomyces sp. NPDC053367]|uniref:hypothetical protein n=1 Tax=Streptomyces sp. NPDC053367 TaxID=3365700 RepID=UPI0037D2E813